MYFSSPGIVAHDALAPHGLLVFMLRLVQQALEINGVVSPPPSTSLLIPLPGAPNPEVPKVHLDEGVVG